VVECDGFCVEALPHQVNGLGIEVEYGSHIHCCKWCEIVKCVHCCRYVKAGLLLLEDGRFGLLLLGGKSELGLLNNNDP
jgi:hypothetical protein